MSDFIIRRVILENGNEVVEEIPFSDLPETEYESCLSDEELNAMFEQLNAEEQTKK